MVYSLEVPVHVAGGVPAVVDVAVAELALGLRGRHVVEVGPDPAAAGLLRLILK